MSASAVHHRSSRSRLLGGCAVAVLATLAAAPSRAQFAGSITSSSGINTATSNAGTINVTAAQAVVNWQPSDASGGPIDFLPSAATATFNGTGAYTVLNRILPSNGAPTVAINGTVNSGSNGSIWFYSPGGIIAGATARFNVGNLVLTANDIPTADVGQGTIRFGNPANPTRGDAAIDVLGGAQFNLSATDSYLVLVAPRVSMGGTAVGAGGASISGAAYVGAEDATVTIRANGLFDISFNTGTGAADAVTQTATGNTTVGSNGGVFLAAMPKNDAITALLLGGTIVAPATTASIQNGRVVLSGGYDVANGAIANVPGATSGAADITITATSIATSSLYAHATRNLLVQPGALSVQADAALAGDRSASVTANGGTAVIAIGGNLDLLATGGAVGGDAELTAIGGGIITVGGTTTINADGQGSGLAATGAAGVGGTAMITVDGGSVTLGAVNYLSADGTGGAGIATGGTGSGGTAGIVVRNATGQGQGLVMGSAQLFARGFGGESGYGAPFTGGSGQGGHATVDVNGNFTAANVTLDASSGGSNFFRGSGGGTGRNGDGGAATGGTAAFAVTGGTATLNALGLLANAVGGDSQSDENGHAGGAATSGIASLDVTGGAFKVLPGGYTQIDANAQGGNGSSVADGGPDPVIAGGVANAGSSGGIHFNVGGGATAEFGYGVYLNAIGVGGMAVGGVSGSGTGAGITIGISGTAVGGDLGSAGGYQFSAVADGRGGSADLTGIGGDGKGGTVEFTVSGGDFRFGDVLLQADGISVTPVYYGDCDCSFPGFSSQSLDGVGTGGTVTALISGGFSANSLTLAADGIGYDSDYGYGAGGGTGGLASLTLSGGAIMADFIDVSATGIAGNGLDGYSITTEQGSSVVAATPGRSGSGGSAAIVITGGVLGGRLDGTGASVSVDAQGFGGAGGNGSGVPGAAGGAGTGNSAGISVSADAAANFSNITITARGQGGDGGGQQCCAARGFSVADVDDDSSSAVDGGAGGSGQGGVVSLNLSGVGPALSNVTVDAGARGGDGGYGAYDYSSTINSGKFGGAGGDATGGNASTLIIAGGSANAAISVTAGATGGSGGGGENGGRAGAATAGTALASITASGDEGLDLASISVLANAESGYGGYGLFVGGAGGLATGGAASLTVAGELYARGVEVRADARANGGGYGDYDGGGNGGGAVGGTASLLLGSDGDALGIGGDGGEGVLSLSADAAGGYGGDAGYADNGASAATGGRGGAATGGAVHVSTTGAALDFGNIDNYSFSAAGRGGDGGEGGAGASATTPGAAGGTGGVGGAGGTGTGGTLEFSITNGGSVAFNNSAAFELNGYGGDGGEGGLGGRGAAGAPGLPGASGGPGGAGGAGGSGGNSGRSGDGGAGTGGSIIIEASGGGAFTASALSLNANGYGGSPGDLGTPGSGGVGGDGGNGGDGVPLGNGGNGGDGGRGGDGGGTDGYGAPGVGSGGTVRLTASGGLIIDGESVVSRIAPGELTVNVDGNSGSAFYGINTVYGYGGQGGQAGQGGAAGPAGPVSTSPGNSGQLGQSGADFYSAPYGYYLGGAGGTATIEALTDSGIGGTVDLGNVTINAGAYYLTYYQYYDGESYSTGSYSSDFGNFGTIALRSSGATARFTAASVAAYAGDAFSCCGGGGITVDALGSTVDVGSYGYFSATGPITVNVAGEGGLLSSGSLSLYSGGNILVAHDSPPEGDFATVLGSDISLYSRGDIDTRGTRIVSAGSDFGYGGSDINISAYGRADIGVLDSSGSISVGAGSDITIVDATARGQGSDYGYGGLSAGYVALVAGDGGEGGGLSAADLTVTGAIDAAGAVSITGGRNVLIGDGASVRADDRIDLISGGDIVIAPGAAIEAARNPSQESGYGYYPPDYNNALNLDAGGASVNYDRDPVSSLVIAGLVDVHGGTATLTAGGLGDDSDLRTATPGAIDASRATILAGSLYADLRNASAVESPDDDGGLLGAACVAGNICLGAVNAATLLHVGDNGVPNAVLLAGSIDTDDLSVISNGPLSFGDGANPIVINGATNLYLESRGGDVVFSGPVDVTGGSGSYALLASGNIDGPAARLISAGDIALKFDGNLSLDTLDAAGRLLTPQVDADPLTYLSTDGAVAVTSLFHIGTGDIDIRAGAGITLGQVDLAGGNDIVLTSAGGSVTTGSIGNAGYGRPRNVTIDADGAVFVEHLEASGDFGVTAASFDTGPHSIIVDGDIDMSVAGDLDFGNSTAGGHIAGDAGGAISFTSLAAGSYIDLQAASGISGGDATSGTGGLFLSTSSGDIGFGNLVAGSGTLSINGPGAVTGTSARSNLDLILSADTGGLALGSGVAARDVFYSTSNGGNISVGTTTAGGSVSIRDAGDLTLATTNANGGYVDFGYGPPSPGAFFADVAGSATLGTINAADSIGVHAASVTGGSLTSGEDIFVRSPGDVSLALAHAGDDVDVTGAVVTVDNAVATGLGRDDQAISYGVNANGATGFSIDETAGDGANIIINATGAATIGSADAQDAIAIAAGSLIATAMAAGTTVNVVTAGDASLGATAAGTDATIAAANGAITASDLRAGGVVDARGASLSIFGGAGLHFTAADAGAGDALLATAAALTIDRSQVSGSADYSSGESLTLGESVVAGGSLNLDAGGAAVFNGLAIGASIGVRSADIAIGSEAQLGAQGTTSQIIFTNDGGGQTFIGGGATGTGYRLGDAELQRAFADDITIAVLPPQRGEAVGGQTPAAITPNATPNVVLDTLTLTAVPNGQSGATAGNIGTAGTLRIQTPGVLRVIGAVRLNGANQGNRVEIAADTAIEAQPSGSIALNGANGLTGTLALDSADVIASSAQALADVAGAATLKAASDRLGINDGAVNDTGYFAAGGIVVTASNSVYIQNSGTNAGGSGTRDFSGRRGFTVGDGGFTVVAAGQAPVRIAVNGRQVSAAGGYFTGLDLIPRIVITSPDGSQSGQDYTAFDPQSTVNGCLIVGGVACGSITYDPGAQARDEIENEIEQMATGQLLPVALIELKEFEGFTDQPLIDEPVTGAGNDDLYAIDDSEQCEAEKAGDPTRPCK